MTQLSEALDRLNKVCAKMKLQRTGECPECGYPEKGADLCAPDKDLPDNGDHNSPARQALQRLYNDASYRGCGYDMETVRDVLINAKPVDNAPLRDDKTKAVEWFDYCVSEMSTANYDDIEPFIKTIRAALQPTVTIKHEEIRSYERSAIQELLDIKSPQTKE